MSDRAQSLADRLEETNQEVIATVEGAPNGDLSAICPGEGWTAAALGAHIGGSYMGIVNNLLKPLVAGEEIPPFDRSAFDGGNAQRAAEHAAMPRDAVLALLREQGAEAANYVRGLSDEDLDRATSLAIPGDEPASVQDLIELVLIGHAAEHLQSLRQGLA